MANIPNRIQEIKTELETGTPRNTKNLESELRMLSGILDLWRQFGDIPMDPKTECLEEPFQDFPAGTHREDIWHWFEETFLISVAEDLMY